MQRYETSKACCWWKSRWTACQSLGGPVQSLGGHPVWFGTSGSSICSSTGSLRKLGCKSAFWLPRWGLRQVPHLPLISNNTSRFLENTELANSCNESSANVSKVTYSPLPSNHSGFASSTTTMALAPFVARAWRWLAQILCIQRQWRIRHVIFQTLANFHCGCSPVAYWRGNVTCCLKSNGKCGLVAGCRTARWRKLWGLNGCSCSVIPHVMAELGSQKGARCEARCQMR